MINKVILIGNLGKDPELTYTQSGVAVAKVSLATTERWKDRNGENKDTTEWHNLVFWRRQAEIANEYLRRGSQIYVEGKISYRVWEDRDGNKRYNTDIVVQNFQMLGKRSGSEGSQSYQGQGSSPRRDSYQEGKPPQSQPAQDNGIHYEPINGNDGGDFGPKDDLPF